MDKSLPEHEALLSEFDAWQTKNPKKIICRGKSVTEDGRLVLNLSINETSFSFLCPSNYPNHEDPFFVETECTDFWCIALNEFVTDSPEKLTLDVILAKAFLYYTPASTTPAGQASENENENESEIENESEDETDSSDEAGEWESIITKKKKEWREKEGQLRLRYNRPKISDMFDGKILDYPHQVFSNSAASEILINDLINIIVSKDASGIVVDPVENDVCRWSVFLQDFRHDSRIFKDLIEAKELFGYDRVQLQLDFAMDSYPSHPPRIRIIGPKLTGVFEARDSIELANWNPAKNMMSVLKEIKDYIENNAAIDFEDGKNGIKLGEVKKILKELEEALKLPESAPEKTIQETDLHSSPILFMSGSDHDFEDRDSAVEAILAKFSYLVKNPGCENLPEESEEDERLFTFNLALNNNIFHEKNYEVTSEASTYSSFTFNAIKRMLESERLDSPRRYLNRQKAYTGYEKNHCNITTNPSFGLGFESRDTRGLGLQKEKYSIDNVSVCETLDAVSSYENRKRKDKSCKSSERGNDDYFVEQFNDTVVSSFNAKVNTVEESSATALNNPRLGLNGNISGFLKALEDSVLLSLVRSKLSVDGFFGIWLKPSLYSKIIQVVVEMASNPHLINLLTVSDIRNQSIADLVKIQGESSTMILQQLNFIEKSDAYFEEQVHLDKTELAKRIIDAFKLIESQTIKYWSRSNTEDLDSIHNRVESLESTYRESLDYLKFCNCDINPESHTFTTDNESSSGNYFRFAQEFAALSKSLTIELSSSIFVRVDYSQPCLMRAVITGPDGTLCNGGCFTFDIHLRNDHPRDCGFAISCTTFPDEETSWLNDRIVSLSYRGSVSCPDPESRIDISNILQVLTYIQTETLRSYEIWRENSEETGTDESALSNIIRYSMIDKMCRPTPGFEDVIAIHFRLKKDSIISELERYDFLKNSELLDSLKTEFDRLGNTENL